MSGIHVNYRFLLPHLTTIFFRRCWIYLFDVDSFHTLLLFKTNIPSQPRTYPATLNGLRMFIYWGRLPQPAASPFIYPSGRSQPRPLPPLHWRKISLSIQFHEIRHVAFHVPSTRAMILSPLIYSLFYYAWATRMASWFIWRWAFHHFTGRYWISFICLLE